MHRYVDADACSGLVGTCSRRCANLSTNIPAAPCPLSSSYALGILISRSHFNAKKAINLSDNMHLNFTFHHAIKNC